MPDRRTVGRGISRLPVPASVERALDTALDKALAVQRPVVLAYLARVRAKNPDAPPARVMVSLERAYLATVAGTGAASGGAAALPGVGTVASLATGVAEVGAFVSATAMYVLAVAELHGVPVSDPEVRRALVLAALVGDVGAGAIEATAGTAGASWAEILGRTTSRDRIKQLNTHLLPMLVGRFGARQGALLAGRALPLGIGAGVGAVGNVALARGAIAATHRMFGPAPASLPARVIDARPGGRSLTRRRRT